MKSPIRYFAIIFSIFSLFFNIFSVQAENQLTPKKDKKEHLRNDKASNSRSDTLDILNYTLDIDITSFAAREIKGIADIQFVTLKSGVSNLYFDLLKLTVDSIIFEGNAQTFSHNDTLINVALSSALTQGDTSTIQIYYHGNPVRDVRWGGFYFQGDYAYNLGVGFVDNPHNYGRVWFPCFDNFVERSTYTFRITTADGRKAHCNGHLVNETVIAGDTIMREWRLDEEIPTYLVGVAVSTYETVKYQHNGMLKSIPVELAAQANDTVNVKSSFTHLPDAIDAYETAFGPYLFSKVGYSIVPFNAGAMEHATNIAYPRYAVNGTLGNETLMAHELSHHWWGNLVTCETAEDMWLNEGMASYSEHLFLEHLYGKEAYQEAVDNNHENVLHYAHIREGEYRAVSGIPHDYTYGMHVYDKGAVIAHNLRTYMGDSLFFSGMSTFLTNNAFSAINSTQLRNELNAITGLDLTDYFNDWVFKPGFAHFAIDSVVYAATPGNYDVSVFIRQKRRGSPTFYSNVPLEITFRDENKNLIVEQIVASSGISSYQFSIPIKPEMVTINENGRINQAVTAHQRILDTVGTYNFRLARMEVNIKQPADSSFLRVEHHWAHPDPLKSNPGNIRMSDYRYWMVDGILADNFSASAEVFFDGRRISSGGEGSLDVDLLSTGEDSILLMHRSGPAEDWKEYRYYQVDNLNSQSDRYGRVTIDSLQKGEYTLAKGQSVVGIPTASLKREAFSIYPNPANGKTGIDVVSDQFSGQLVKAEIYDVQGKKVKEVDFKETVLLETNNWNSGNYVIILSQNGQRIGTAQLVVQ